MGSSPAQVESELEHILNSPEADALYDAIAEARGGRVINSDIARELSPHYRTKADRIAYTLATYKPAARYVYNRFMETVAATPGEGRIALLLAGGPASGKTASVGGRIDDYDLVFDTTLSVIEKARPIIQQLLDHHWQVHIQYIHRPYDLAVGSMLERALRTGRYVGLGHPSRLARVHMAAQNCFNVLQRQFTGTVELFVTGNFWTPDDPDSGAHPLSLNALDSNGFYY